MIDVDTSILPKDPLPKLVSLVWLYDDGSTINIGFSIIVFVVMGRVDNSSCVLRSVPLGMAANGKAAVFTRDQGSDSSTTF